MSTSCIIGYREAHDKIRYSYCHWDGYPEGVGKILYENYNTPELAQAVASLTGFSCLEPTLEATAETQYSDGFGYGVVTPSEFKAIQTKYVVDYVYLYDSCGWIVRPAFGYSIESALDNDYLKFL